MRLLSNNPKTKKPPMTDAQIMGQAMDDRVLAYLKARPGHDIGPTEIGTYLKFDYGSASSRVMAPLKRLIAAGKVESKRKGKYRTVPEAGRAD